MEVETPAMSVPTFAQGVTNSLVLFTRASGIMLLGMALYKLGVLSAARSRRFYATLIAVAVFVGLPLIWYGMQYNFSIDWRAPRFFLFGLQFNYWASLLVALGSGFVISEDGFIVTNNHVIEGADEITVRLSNDKEYDAEIVGRELRTRPVRLGRRGAR
mgnify:CR=1 FL=1